MSTRLPSSYRDPSGFLFKKEGILYRQVNQEYAPHYDQLMKTGLYESLTSQGLLIPHEESVAASDDASCYRILRPEPLPFISHPSEWSFDMLKDAALLTLKIAGEAIRHGMILKDASAYNCAFYKGKMIFIDTLSFEQYDESRPWIAYRQFCEHFLSPLALMHYSKSPLQDLWNAYPEGLPVALAATLLPFKSKMNLHTWLHIHLHAKMSSAGNTGNSAQAAFTKTKLLNVLKSLEQAISKFSLKGPSGVWSDYYEEAGTRDDYMERKKALIIQLLENIDFKTAADLGANEGFFARIPAGKGAHTLAADLDHYSINNLYLQCRNEKNQNILPMVVNLAHPTPATGFANQERASFLERLDVDLVMALALIHHLSIGHNIPFDFSAKMFSRSCRWLLIEFVPKQDDKVQLMLKQKKDIYDWYTREVFEASFTRYFHIRESRSITGTERILYLMEAYDHQQDIQRG